MNYISTTEAAKKWGISSRRVMILAKSARIPGAIKVGSRYLIPDNVNKPLDNRYKENKENIDNSYNSFRYPTFEGRDVDSFNPPLSKEELIIKASSEAFHQGDFIKANELILPLLNQASNCYNKIKALHIICMVDLMLIKTDEFLNNYGLLKHELQKDFPYKKELESLTHEIDATIGINDYFTSFTIDTSYVYHESYMPHLASSTLIALNHSNVSNLNEESLLPYEYIVANLNNQNSYVDEQCAHFYLGLAYSKLLNTTKANIHFKKALEISKKYHLYYQAALFYYYFGKSLNETLLQFDMEFIAHIQSLSEDLHSRYLSFIEEAPIKSIYGLLSNQDFIYVFYAIHGLTNKEVAKLLNVSEKSIEKKYIKLYNALGVTKKQEMVDLYFDTTKANKKFEAFIK